MAITLVCGQCQGRLLAEQPGTVVACPHCGTHLHVPGDPTVEPPPEELPPPPAPVPVVPTELVSSQLEPVESPAVVAVPGSMPTIDSAPPPEPVPHPIIPPVAAPPVPSAAVTAALQSSSPPSPPSATSELPESASFELASAATVPRFWFLMALSYASAVTLAFLFLLLVLARMKSHPLESLPDIVPKIQKNGEVALQIAPPDAGVAPGHLLKLGQPQRFGSLKVTPLRVTQGPLQFEHLLKDPTARRAESSPVLKLWLKFENVSYTQTFQPLDAMLLFKRHYQGLGGTVRTNQFLCRTDERHREGDLRHVFEISPTSEFQIVGQNLETLLGPGESMETFIPSEERIDNLSGDLIWRVQFRKGYHSRTLHGVTTLIDVTFNRTDVKKES